jgi:glycine dehydrogenase subunit 1
LNYIPITCEQREAMLRAVGVSDVDELFVDIPAEVRLDRPLAIDTGLSEIDLVRHMRTLAESNTPASSLVSFAGAGCYDHYVPSVVDHVLRRPEFFTAYTPYQAETSQGTLQAIYEYQSMMCSLTGLDVANASMYDGATAFVEAAMMGCRLTKRSTVICATTVHPEWQATLATYAEAGTFTVRPAASTDGASGRLLVGSEGHLAGRALADQLGSGDVAAVLVQSPNFFGNLEDLAEIGRMAHEAGALLVVAANPIMLGVMETPAALGADIVVGEGQALGSATSFGGPGFGFFTCKKEHVRQMPGRVVGRTVDVDSNTAFVLTLSTREQHIRREKATSNICSNQALSALAAAVYLSAVGSEGLAGIAEACIAKAHYLRARLIETGKFSSPWSVDPPFGYEFALAYNGDAEEMRELMLERGYLAGVPVSQVEGEWPTGLLADVGDDVVLFAVTEKRTRAEVDAFVGEVSRL